MRAWLNARSWRLTKADQLDADSIEEWSKETLKKYLKFKKNIFDKNGRLLPHTADSWNDEWIELVKNPPELTEDDIPF